MPTDGSLNLPCLLVGTSSAIELMSSAERADLKLLLSLDTADEELYERLAAEFPEEEGDATRTESSRHAGGTRLHPLELSLARGGL
jgi:hypothetical protein